VQLETVTARPVLPPAAPDPPRPVLLPVPRQPERQPALLLAPMQAAVLLGARAS